MTKIDKKPDTFSNTKRSDLSSFELPVSMDCSPFLNWDGDDFNSFREVTVVFRSLVDTVKTRRELDAPLETKAVRFLNFVVPGDEELTDSFLRNLASLSDNSLTNFTQSIGVLISSVSQNITTAAMAMVRNVIERCSHHHRLTLIKAALIPQIVITLNPQSHSFVDAVDIHTCLMRTITCSLWLTTPSVLASLTVKDGSEQQAVHETVLTQVLIPSEKYIRHLCVNRFSILDGKQSRSFLDLLARLLEICPYYQPTMDVVLHMPVFFTIPSSLTFFDHNLSIWTFLIGMNNTQLEWNEQGGKVRQMWKTMHRMLRMEGFEDGKEAKLQNDRNATDGRWIVYSSIGWNNKLGMNVPKLW